jgi:3-oxoacyl-[acyl-carrier-protein] synthase-3
MACLRALGRYLPSRIVGNAEIGRLVEADPAWILQATGIEQRRYAAPEESVASIGVLAARDCLESSGLEAAEIGLIVASSGSAALRFPGPAAAIGSGLGIAGTPAIDLPLASAGSLFGLALAADLCRTYGNVLVVASEIMSRAVRTDPGGRDTAILFGDGAGACLVSPDTGFATIADSVLHSDGGFADALRLDLNAPLHMDGRTIILQASRKLPRAITELLDRNHHKPEEIGTFLMHQANLNLMVRVAQALGVPESKFFRNVGQYGNTSSASLLIAAADWWRETGPRLEAPIVLAAFGAGLHWGALLANPVPPVDQNV